MKLDPKEVAVQLIRRGVWEDAEAPPGERPRSVLLLDEITTGRRELVSEMRTHLPSLTLAEGVGKIGDAMVEVDRDELQLRQELLRSAAGTIHRGRPENSGYRGR